MVNQLLAEETLLETVLVY